MSINRSTIYTIMKNVQPKEFFKIELDLTKGSAYEDQTNNCKINTIINFRRFWNGKMEKGSIKGLFTHKESLNIVYFLKRGYSRKEINKMYQITT